MGGGGAGLWRRAQADRLTDYGTKASSFHPSEPQGPDLQDGNDSETNDLGPWCPKCVPGEGSWGPVVPRGGRKGEYS